MNPETRLLRSFIVVAEELNFTRAAENLNIAQSALSAQIRQLEAQLDVTLLERTTRSVALTEAGRILLERGPVSLASLDEAWEETRRAGRGEAGRLRLVYSPSTGYETAPRLVEALTKRHPEIEVVAEVLSTPEVVQTVADGTADIGLARTPRAVDGTRLREVRVERQGVLIRVDHPLATFSEVSVADASAYAILLHPRSTNPGHYDQVFELFRHHALEPRLAARPVAFDPSQRVIRGGDAIGIVGASSADGIAEGLRWLPLADPVPRLLVQLVARTEGQSPASDRFERAAVAFAASAGWLR
jgi:LysR family transcriptional regulator, benzoate and cis,cis-muconate-responsive activator of ben and cat genes